MDAAQALTDLTEISSQIEAAVVLDPNGVAIASTLPEPRSTDLARTAKELLAAVGTVAGGEGREPAQIEVATREGSVFLVRDDERVVAATTGPEPTVGLVFYDLKSCLRSIAAGEKPKPRRTPRKSGDREQSDAAA
ncbi:MAG TPA: roadblock/LC7 domain-containing protein [Gaiellaceae bacterium]|nr:roadblock/LC7 domain-containing protein [Gaiellaceae bacterium]